jgi:hypothetical protein
MATFEKSKTVKTVRCNLKAAPSPFRFAINGQIVPVGAIVEVSSHEARDLIGRKLAVDATPAEVTAAGVNVIVAISRDDKWADA